jgi:tetratricopeptide (TPR) repeat protein
MVGKASIRLGCIVLMATSLGGCGRALEFLGLRHGPGPEVEVRTAGVQDAAGAVAAGRAHLAAGRTGKAIEEFQRALAAGEEIAAAANGMGVAYARLGRFEQAHRFFAQAVAVDPGNMKYQDNMRGLMRSALVAQRHETDFAAQVAARTLVGPDDLQRAASKAEVAAVTQPEAGNVRSAMRSGSQASMTRISRGEVMIRSAGPAADARGGPLPVVGVRGSEKDNFKAAVRIEFSGRHRAKDAPEAERTEQDEAPAKAASADIGAFEPLVRIDFPPARRKP